MGVDHGGLQVFVAEQLLHSANVIAGFQQMSGKAMTEGVAGRWFRQSGRAHSLLHGALEPFFIEMVPTNLT